ncbi:MAG: hypothetical protein JWO80_5745 [Bryobacterales bacterium]|nr:hypothetical protein [Bryobacterales bacterium]
MTGYWLSRLVFQRALGLVYLIAFICALNQFRPLLGERGLLPATAFIKQVSFREAPSLFYLFPKDIAFTAAAWLGIILSCLAITGISERYAMWVSMLVWAALWALYMSFVNVGQTFYGFGWESLLLECGFFAAFLGSRNVAPQAISMWLLRWLAFRLMFGAGLIKLRGDTCWHDLTCLDYHYETQPMPNPLSWYFHWAPAWTHRAGVLFNHFSELVVPFGYFLPQPVSSVAGIITVVFQGSIMASGNLSWLNFLTMILAIPMIDDRVLGFLVRSKTPVLEAPPFPYQVATIAVAILVAVLSINPIRNMLSPRQAMNASFNPLHLVDTYGAFGSITRTRNEVIVEGTDEAAVTQETKWREYEFRGKPGELGRMPPQIAPYHLRLDWLMWFAAMDAYYRNPWFVHFVARLLQGDRDTLGLLRVNPFGDKRPRYVRALLYEYHFTTPDERKRTGLWWKRSLVRGYFPPVSLDMPEFRAILDQQGWK